MLYRRNMGASEGWARVVGGVLTVLTGLGYCPACAIAGRKPLEGPP